VTSTIRKTRQGFRFRGLAYSSQRQTRCC